MRFRDDVDDQGIRVDEFFLSILFKKCVISIIFAVAVLFAVPYNEACKSGVSTLPEIYMIHLH